MVASSRMHTTAARAVSWRAAREPWRADRDVVRISISGGPLAHQLSQLGADHLETRRGMRSRADRGQLLFPARFPSLRGCVRYRSCWHAGAVRQSPPGPQLLPVGATLRFALGSNDGPRSNTWSVVGGRRDGVPLAPTVSSLPARTWILAAEVDG